MKNFNYTKQWLVLVILGLFLFSCSRDDQSEIQQEPSNFIKEEIAIDIAKKINIDSKSSYSKKAATKEEKKIGNILPVKDESNETVFYIVNYEGDGFMILSADNRVSPILAYSDTNTFRTNAESYPSGLVEWLSLTKEKVKSVRLNNEKQSEELKIEWENLISSQEGNISQLKEDPIDPNDCEDEHEQVGPLLSTTWNQTCGYNDYMPVLNCDAGCSYNNRAYAGFVPVAIAQVMKFHEYPTNYNWTNMPNTYGTTTTASLINDIHNSISGISYDCDGTGVDKDYNTAGVFTNHFNYSTASQGGYNRDVVKQQLRSNRPVILGGGRDAGWWIFHDYADGHMWVCDGFRRSLIWSEDCSMAWGYLYFHMNWGWGGYENGWYAFNNFNPGNNTFNYKVKMVYNIKP
ncbi:MULTISPECIES: C10 family peptidase [Arenibacter]|uniref:C10 family peptidase n=1 Tax=Arenibacter TaxID=178469 RepID=UPI000A3990D4|nr:MULTISPECIES: C10 family peptidase [Arenibacter]